VQVRHRFTSHGFSLNVTREPLPWFDQIVACGLADVTAGCIENVKKEEVIGVHDEILGLLGRFGQQFGREMVELDVEKDEVGGAILIAENEMRQYQSAN